MLLLLLPAGAVPCGLPAGPYAKASQTEWLPWGSSPTHLGAARVGARFLDTMQEVGRGCQLDG